MNRTLLAVTLVVTCLATSLAFAHDQSLHKGRPTEGEILSVESDHLVLETEGGEKTVTLSENPKIEVGDAQGSLADLKSGARVAVFGTKLPGGKIVAKEIIIQRHDPQHHDGEGDRNEASPHETHE